jgi:hypothetical protein
MRDAVVFFHIKDRAAHPLTRIGYTSINSDGDLIVYCTDDGPLDGQYRALWLEWKKGEAAKVKGKAKE